MLRVNFEIRGCSGLRELEWLSRDNLLSPPLALVSYGPIYVKS